VAYALTRHLETICEFSWKARDWLSNAQYASPVPLLVYLISQSNVPLPCMCTFCPFCFLISEKNEYKMAAQIDMRMKLRRSTVSACMEV